MKYIEKSAKTIEEAVEIALKELNVSKSEVEVEVLEQPSKGLFGIIGTRQAKVRVTLNEKPNEAAKPKEVRQTRPIRVNETRTFCNTRGLKYCSKVFK